MQIGLSPIRVDPWSIGVIRVPLPFPTYHLPMITPEMLEILRCPMDPAREAKLVIENDTRLLCGRCRLQFRIREGFPSLLVEEATLPEGCTSTAQLPCQRN